MPSYPRESAGACLAGLYDNAIDRIAAATEDVFDEAVSLFGDREGWVIGFLCGLTTPSPTLRGAEPTGIPREEVDA
jgi:hypothetical protein